MSKNLLQKYNVRVCISTYTYNNEQYRQDMTALFFQDCVIKVADIISLREENERVVETLLSYQLYKNGDERDRPTAISALEWTPIARNDIDDRIARLAIMMYEHRGVLREEKQQLLKHKAQLFLTDLDSLMARYGVTNRDGNWHFDE